MKSFDILYIFENGITREVSPEGKGSQIGTLKLSLRCADRLHDTAYKNCMALSAKNDSSTIYKKDVFLTPDGISTEDFSLDVVNDRFSFYGINIRSYCTWEINPTWGDGLEIWHDIIILLKDNSIKTDEFGSIRFVGYDLSPFI